MQKDILVVLGSPNSPEGLLSDISKSRLDYCKHIHNEGQLVLCTGGWGAHFNTSKHSHASYAKAYLIKNGLLEKDFLEFALSGHTVDDAVKVKPILSRFHNPNVIIITSDYHIERVKLIFEEILAAYKLEFVGVESNIDKEQFQLLVKHEKKRIHTIKENGLYY